MAPGTSEGEWETKAAKLGAEVKVTGKYDDNPTGRREDHRPIIDGIIMCGHFTLKTSRAIIAELLGLKKVPTFEPRFNIAPSQPVLAVRLDPGSGEREGTLLKWGLIPSWAKEPGIGESLINARAETVAEKPAFRSAFKKRRCLILADGFYEWKRDKGGKTQWHLAKPTKYVPILGTRSYQKTIVL